MNIKRKFSAVTIYYQPEPEDNGYPAQIVGINRAGSGKAEIEQYAAHIDREVVESDFFADKSEETQGGSNQRKITYHVLTDEQREKVTEAINY